MKKYLLLIILLITLIGINDLKAQLDLFGGYGWQIGGRARFYEGDIKIKSNGQWHVGIDKNIAPDMSVRFEYSQMANATADWLPLPGYSNLLPAERFKMDVHYFQLAAVRGIPMDNIEPYGTLGLGASWFAATTLDGQEIGDVTRFAATLGGGAKIFFSEKVGLKLQARLLLPMYFAGVGLWAGTGGGGLSVGTAIPIVQADFTGGLVVRLGE